jgi:hypothetical protein
MDFNKSMEMNERILKMAAQSGLLNEDSQGYYIDKRADVKEVEEFANTLIREILMFNKANLMIENDPEDNSEFAISYSRGWNQKTLDMELYLSNYFGVK